MASVPSTDTRRVQLQQQVKVGVPSLPVGQYEHLLGVRVRQRPSANVGIEGVVPLTRVEVLEAQVLPLGPLVGMVRDDLRARIKPLGERLEVVESAFSALDPPAPGIRYLWAGCKEAALTAIADGSKGEQPPASRPVKYLIDQVSGAPPHAQPVRPIGHQTARETRRYSS